MHIADYLTVADITLDAGCKNKRHLLETLAAQAAERTGIPEQDILTALQSREKLGSTALGKGVALPHAEVAGITRPAMLFSRLRQPIDFDAPDGEPVDIVFVMLWPAEDTNGLLDSMAEICRTLRDPQLLRQLHLSKGPDVVIRLLQDHSVNPGPQDPDASP